MSIAAGIAIHGYDVALEGRAARVSDDALLQRLAAVFAEGGWAPTVAHLLTSRAGRVASTPNASPSPTSGSRWG
ncbi:MAG TPA: hypothetical protein VK360_08285 [Acidimicrobiales bacterium]|nr:hypothetical protein [Acidimicrobiales bacterium]